MTDRRILMVALVVVAGCVLCIPQRAFSQTPAEANPSGLCELKIEGRSILSLTLLREDGASGAGGLAGETFQRPGASLRLPAGRYQVLAVKLEGGYESANNYTRPTEWLELSPDKPCQLVVGAPLSPQVTVNRHGKFLEMDCDLVDAAGRTYSWSADGAVRPAAPQFTVYKDDQVLGSGSFEYG